MKRVVIESPYASSDPVARESNVAYAQACLLDSLTKGEAPFASHLLYTQVLEDEIPEDRRRGIEAGLRAVEGFELTAVYADWGITRGMLQGLRAAGSAMRPFEIRYLHGVEPRGDLEQHRSECYEAWNAGREAARGNVGRIIGVPAEILGELRRAWQMLDDAIGGGPRDALGAAMTAAALSHRAMMKLESILKREFWG